MSISERKIREKIELKEKILEAAYQLFIQNGYEIVSIRNIAKIIEYSPSTIYLYYRDKTELFYDIQKKLFREYSQMLTSKLSPIEDPFEKFRKMADITIQFAIEKPEVYYFMYLQEEPKKPKEGSSVWNIGTQSRTLLNNLIIECKTAGYFKNRDTDVVGYCSWACVHGMATTIVTKRMRKEAHDLDEEKKLKEKMLNGALPLFEEMLKNL